MGPYLGDFKVSEDIIVFFDTNDKNGGAIDPSITAANIKVYKDGDAGTEISVDGDEYTESFDSLDGINKIVLDVSDHDTFYTAGSDFSVVLSTATIDGETVRAVLATFSIENRFPGSSLFQKAAKSLINKAVQTKATGAIDYYDDDGETVLLTHTPTDAESTITRTPS